MSRRDFDDAAERFDAGERAVAPLRARLEIERHRRRASGCTSRACSRCLRGAIRAPSRLPAPPLSRPEVCVSRSRTVISRSRGHGVDLRPRRCRLARRGRRRPASASRIATFEILELRNEPRHRIGQPHLPSSISIRIATPVTGFDIDAMRKIASLRIGVFVLEVHQALRLEVRDLAAPRHHRHGAGDLALRRCSAGRTG